MKPNAKTKTKTSTNTNTKPILKPRPMRAVVIQMAWPGTGNGARAVGYNGVMRANCGGAERGQPRCADARGGPSTPTSPKGVIGS